MLASKSVMRLRPSLLAAFLLFGCSSSRGEPEPPPCRDVAADAQGACLTQHYFGDPGDAPLPPCGGISPSTKDVGQRREIQFWKSGSSSHGDVAIEGRYLSRYYASYGLTFFTNAPAIDIGFSNALEGTNAEFNQAARSGKSQEEVNRLVADIMFKSVRDFVRSQAEPVKDRVDVVVLDQIASPDVAKQFKGGVIAGLGLSPKLFANIAKDDPSKDLFELLALPREFTPVLFVGHADIVKLAKNAEVVVAHELGHSLGLQHTTESGNLMTQGQGSKACVPALVDAQVEELKRTGTTLEAEESWRVLLDLHHAIVARLMLQRSL